MGPAHLSRVPADLGGEQVDGAMIVPGRGGTVKRVC
jgi:hypothetical protein